MATRIKRDLFSGLLVEETYEPSPTGRSIIAKEYLPPGKVSNRSTRHWISDANPNYSMSLGVYPVEAKKFNRILEDHGVKGARYNEKNGRLKSTDEHSRAAAWALRGHGDRDGNDVADRYSAAIGL